MKRAKADRLCASSCRRCGLPLLYGVAQQSAVGHPLCPACADREMRATSLAIALQLVLLAGRIEAGAATVAVLDEVVADLRDLSDRLSRGAVRKR